VLRRGLTAAGFTVTRGPGFDRKWETTQAVRAGEPPASRALPAVPDGHSVLIIGAGVAGCQLAVRLARAGWQVQLIDAAPGPASGASGNPAGVIRPLLARDDNGVSRYTRAAFLYAIDCWRDGGGRPRAGWHPDGVIQVAQDPDQWTQWQATLAEQGMPAELAWLISPAEARRRLGLRPAAGGLMFPLGGWLEPARLCADLLAGAPEVQVCWSARVDRLEPGRPGWEARDSAGRMIASAAQVVLCVGAGRAGELPCGPDFLPAGLRPLQALRGEVTQLGPEGLGALDAAICGDGYLSPAGHQRFSLGATYDRSGEAQPTEAGRSANLEKLGTLTGLAAGAVVPTGGRVAWRSVAPDRLPVIGADATRPGLWHLRGLASRGLVWSPLAAEQLAAMMNQEPTPVARSLQRLVSIDRPLLKRRDPS
jgi:tRNA 5-methylaminomethyl-2-thiouridine biosynthesis bifunctional protein